MKKASGAWLCIINHKNWEISKEKGIYALHRNCKTYALRNLEAMHKGDMVMLYVTKPLSGIVDTYEVTSKAQINSHETPFGADYPHIIRIEPIVSKNRKVISIHSLVGRISNIRTKQSIQGKVVMPLSEKDVQIIQNLLAK